MMKYLKTYNESLRDKMQPKSEEEILKELGKLTDKEILELSLKNKYFKGVKKILDNNINFTFNMNLVYNYIYYCDNKDEIKYLIFNDNLRTKFHKEYIYIILKYRIGIHKDINKEYEIELNNILKNLVESLPNNFTYKNKDNVLILLEDEELFIDYALYSDKLIKIANEYNLHDIEFDELIRGLLEKKFNRKFKFNNISVF